MRKFLLAITLVLLAACAMNGVQPQNTAETVYYTYGLYTVVDNTAADMVTSGAVKASDAIKIQQQLTQFRTELDAARAIIKAGQNVPDTQMKVLMLAQQTLLQLQQQLIAQAKQQQGGH